MEWFKDHLLSSIVFFPLAWGLLGLALPSSSQPEGEAHAHGHDIPKKIGMHPWWALAGTLITFVLSLQIYFAFDVKGPEFLFVEKAEWLPFMGVQYNVGIDGLGLWLFLLTTFLMPLVVLGAFNAVETKARGFYFLLLMLETAMLGAFVSLDIFLFYVFWEAMLIPMYFLIGVWGGKERIYAATKFFLYTLVGSLLMLVAIFYLGYEHKLQFGNYSASIIDLYRIHIPGEGWASPQSLLFLAFALAFAIKVPLFPFHTWLPDAHVQAPTAGSVILAAVLLKMGGYGFMRFAFPLFPNAVTEFAPVFLALGSVAIIYGAWVAMVQPDVKKLVAYSSVSHMGYVVIGLFSLNSIGVTGAYYQMLNHGISTGALFLLVGMIYERRHTRDISAFGGITKVMPLFAIAFMIITLSSIGLPGTNGFVGEFLILLGIWKTSPVTAIVAASGVIFGAVYMLWMFQRVMFGPVTHKENEHLKDLSGRERLVLAPLICAVFVMGVFPNFFFDKLGPSVDRFLARAGVKSVTAIALNETPRNKQP